VFREAGINNIRDIDRRARAGGRLEEMAVNISHVNPFVINY
jgi:hypothetical protein